MTGPSALPHSSPPRTSRFRALVVVTVGLTVSGAVIGGLWAWIAPSVHGVVVLTRLGDRVQDYLGNEADHFFVAAFLLVGLLSVLAVVATVLVWQWRAHRGPAMVIGVWIGLMAAAADSAAVGAFVVRQRYGAVHLADAPLTPKDPVFYFTQAPPVLFGHTPLQIAATVLFPASLAALVYALLAAAAPRDDLGGYPVVDSHEPPVAVTLSSGPSGSL